MDWAGLGTMGLEIENRWGFGWEKFLDIYPVLFIVYLSVWGIGMMDDLLVMGCVHI